MNKSKLNFIIDMLMFIVIISIISIGLLMKYVLISGTDKWLKYGTNPDMYLLFMDRHDWGYIHFILGYVLIALLILHIILHWKTIVTFFVKYINNKKLRFFISTFIVLLSLLILIIPFVSEVETTPMEKSKNAYLRNNYEKDNGNIRRDEGRGINRTNVKKDYFFDDARIQIRGYMTFEEVSEKYKVPIEYLKKNLGLSPSVSNNERLGIIRREYGFTMNEMEEIIYHYHNRIE